MLRNHSCINIVILCVFFYSTVEIDNISQPFCYNEPFCVILSFVTVYSFVFPLFLRWPLLASCDKRVVVGIVLDGVLERV